MAGACCDHDHGHEGHSHGHVNVGHDHEHAQGPPPSMPSNPALTALLDSLPSVSLPFAIAEIPIPNSQPPQSGQVVVCPAHKQVVCPECGVDYAALNFMQQFMRAAPADAIPPPPNMQPPPQRAEMIKNAKEQGNVSAGSWSLDVPRRFLATRMQLISAVC